MPLDEHGVRLRTLWHFCSTYARFAPAIRGRSAAGSAEPCQGSGRGFEPRRPLGLRVTSCRCISSKSDFSFTRTVPWHVDLVMVEWPRGEARDCKSLYTGSNPVSTSKDLPRIYPEPLLRNQERNGYPFTYVISVSRRP